MAITAFTGPIVQFGFTPSSTAATGLLGADMEHNSQRAPMVSDLGDALMDPRVAYAYQPGSGPSTKTFAFFNNIAAVDYVPSSAATTAFVAASVVSTGVTTFTLAGSTAAGTTATTIIAPETGQASGTLICIGSTASYVTVGSDGTTALWNPGAGAGRTVSITTSSSGDAGTFSVYGRDMYGFKLTETLAVSQGTTNSSGYTITGQKAFKYISSITNTTTPTSTSVSIGFSDVFGFPLAVPYAGLNAQVGVNSSASISAVVPLSTTNFIAALGSSITATSTTADVRGTFKSTTAANSVARLQLMVTPSASAIAAINSTNVTPLFGVAQYSSI